MNFNKLFLFAVIALANISNDAFGLKYYCPSFASIEKGCKPTNGGWECMVNGWSGEESAPPNTPAPSFVKSMDLYIAYTHPICRYQDKSGVVWFFENTNITPPCSIMKDDHGVQYFICPGAAGSTN